VLPLLSLAATVPAWAVLPAALSKRAAEFAQFTDQAVLEMQVVHATRALHLLGPYSRYHWNHPGPLFFYLMAPLYSLSGHATRSIWLSVWLLNAACLSGIVYVTGRTAGLVHAGIAFCLLALQTIWLGPEMLCDSWGPYVVVLPLELCLFTCVAVASGSPRWLPLSVLAGSFAAQTNVSTAPAVASALAVSTACGLLQTWNKAPEGASPEAAPRMARLRAWSLPAVVTVGLSSLVWSPTVLEQARSDPGNLTKLAEFAASSGHHHRHRHGMDEVFRAMSAHLSATLGVDPGYRLEASASAVRPPSEAASLGAWLLVCALPITGFLAVRRKRSYTSNGCAVVAAVTGSVLYAGTRVVGPLMSYLFLWASGIGTLSLMLVGGELIERLRGGATWLRRIPGLAAVRVLPWGPRAGVVVAGVIAGAAFLYGRTEVLAAPYFYGRPASEILPLSEAIERHLRDERLTEPMMRLGTPDRWGTMAGVLLQLYKKGVPFSVDREWRFMFGAQFHPSRPADTYIVFGDDSYEAEAREVLGCALIAQSGDLYVYGSASAGPLQPGERAATDPCP
jgi:hypothetical protein